MEIIKIYRGNVVSARELHTFLGIKSKFADWIKNRISKYHFEEGTDYSKILEQLVRGQKQYDYLLTLSMAKELCMVENNDLGRQARLYFIEAEKTLRQLQENKRLATFFKLEATKEKFRSMLSGKGLAEQDYIEIDTAGKRILMNGKIVDDGLLQTVLLSARDFATNMTHHNTLADNLERTEDIKTENEKNHSSVRETLIENRIVPENLPQQEDIKKLQNGGEGEQET